MIVYLDASVIVKRYVEETGSAGVVDLVDKATLVGTVVISRAEVAAALAKAARMKILARKDAIAAMEAFNADWDSLIRLQLNEVLIQRAALLAWELHLRGYDATHLAAAISWRDVMGEPVTMATYDWQLWDAAQSVGLSVWPPNRGG